jgi:chromosome segregation ATPase
MKLLISLYKNIQQINHNYTNKASYRETTPQPQPHSTLFKKNVFTIVQPTPKHLFESQKPKQIPKELLAKVLEYCLQHTLFPKEQCLFSELTEATSPLRQEIDTKNFIANPEITHDQIVYEEKEYLFNQNEKLNKDITDLKLELNGLSKQVQEQQIQIETISQKNTQLRYDKQQLYNDSKLQKLENENQEKTIEQQNSTIDKLTKQLFREKQKLEEALNKLSKEKSQRLEATSNLQKAQNNFKKTTLQLTILQKNYETKIENYKEMEEECSEEIDMLYQKIGKLKKQNNNLQIEQEQLAKDNVTLKTL